MGISTAGYFLFLTRRVGVRAPVAPLVSIGVVIATQFFFGILGHLRLGAYLALGLGLAGGAYDIFRSRLALKPYYSLGDAAWLVVGALAAVLFYRSIPGDFMFTAWDEFSHWAMSPLEIYRTDALYQADSIVSFKHYPPGTSLFQVYVARFFGYSEKLVLYANILLLVAGLMAAAGGLSRRRTMAGVLLFVLALNLIPHFKHDYGYYHLLVDALLGVVFGAAMVAAIAAPGCAAGLATVSVLVLLLVLIKQVGLLLSLVVCCTCAAGVAWHSFRARAVPSAETARAARSIRVAARDAALPFLVCVFTYLSWSWYVSGIGPLRKVAMPTGGPFEEARLAATVGTLVEFISRIGKPRFFAINTLDVSLSVVGLFTALIGASALTILLTRRGKRIHHIVALALTVAGCVGYLLFLLFSYLSFFIEYEAVRVVSLERYLGTYFIGWFLILLGMAAACLDSVRRRALRYALAAGLLAYMYVYPVTVMEIMRTGPPLLPDKVEERRHELRLATHLLRVASRGDEALYVRQNSSGYEALVFQYLISPLRRSGACYSFGAPYTPTDSWTCNKSLAAEITHQKFVVISFADSQFWDSNATLFDPQDRGAKDGVFKVEREGTVVRLRRAL